MEEKERQAGPARSEEERDREPYWQGSSGERERGTRHGGRDHGDDRREGGHRGRPQEGRRPHEFQDDTERRAPQEGRRPHEFHENPDREGPREGCRGRKPEFAPDGEIGPCEAAEWRNRQFRPEEGDLVCLLRRCGHYLHRRNGENRSQNRILYILMDRETMTQKELTEILHIQPGSMSEILTKLEGRGYLTRERDEKDHRKVVLRITAQGRETAMTWKEDSVNELFADLTQEERDQLKALLIKVLRSWDGRE